MPYTKLFSERYVSAKQIACFGIVIGLIAALSFGSLFSFILYSKRTASYDALAQNMSQYLHAFFSRLQTTVQQIEPLLAADCAEINQELTATAAFNSNVRTFILVHNGTAYCSSAMGKVAVPLKQLAPGLNENKPLDIDIMASTVKMPDHAVIAAWFRSTALPNRGIYATISFNLTPYLLFSASQRDITSVALVAGDNALTSRNDRVVKKSALASDPTRIVKVPDYPIELYLFGTAWRTEDMELSVLASVIFGLLIGALAAYVLYAHRRPENELLAGIRQDQFFLAYQPTIAASGSTPLGVEVLMRWQHHTAGLIPPDIFINVAEAQQLIVPLTRHLFSLVVKDAPILKLAMPAGSKLAINLSPSHLYSPTFKEDVQALADALPASHFQVVFEITERGMLEEKEASEIFNWLHERGFSLAVDDFGTGNSALIYLDQFELDYLKIDKRFIDGICFETSTAPVLDAILDLASRLNMQTIAEGVETEEQVKWLTRRGVSYLQGYYYSEPLTLEKVVEWYTSFAADGVSLSSPGSPPGE